LEVAVTFAYDGKLPNKAKRREFAVGALRMTLGVLDQDEAVEIGFAEDGGRKVRREQWLV
jgi:hypothetical protein